MDKQDIMLKLKECSEVLTVLRKSIDRDLEIVASITKDLEEISSIFPEYQGYYTRKEAAGIIRCSLVKLHALINDGAIVPVKVGRRTLIPKKEFDDALANGKFADRRVRDSV